MKIAGIDVHRFHLPFSAPVRVGGVALPGREGFILALKGDNGRTGHGEVAPLPGMDATPLDAYRRELSSLRSILPGAPVRFERFQPTEPFLGLLDSRFAPSHWSALTMFGIECALLGLFLRESSTPGPFSHPLPGVAVNGLFMPGYQEDVIAGQIRTLKDAGVKVVKVKIGRLSLEDEVRQILDLTDRLGGGIMLRLDGNGSLSGEMYARYFAALRHLPVEYIEEPLPGRELPPVGEASWPIALDESLRRYLDPDEPRLSLLPPAVRAVILKPGALTGLHAIARCAADDTGSGIKTVLSSSFNTGITLAMLAIFSRFAGLASETAHGLDTLKYFREDILREPPFIHEGILAIPGRLISGTVNLNENRLRKEFS